MKNVLLIGVALVLTGCTSMQPVVGPTPDGRGARVGFITRTGEVVENNWGKILTGAVVAGAVLIANNNDWFQGKGSSAPTSISSGADMQTISPVINGDNNQIHIFVGEQEVK